MSCNVEMRIGEVRIFASDVEVLDGDSGECMWGDATATSAVFGKKSVKSRVCEVG